MARCDVLAGRLRLAQQSLEFVEVALMQCRIVIPQGQEARVETPVTARAEGLGKHPFTDPQQPNPPEGSVL